MTGTRRAWRWGRQIGASRQFVQSLLDLTECPLREPHGAGDVAKADDLYIQLEGLPIRLGGAREVLLLLRHSSEGPRRSRQRLAADPVTIRELRRFAIAGGVPETLCLCQRIGCAVDVLEAVNECSSESEKWIRPIRPEFCSFPKSRHCLGELLLRF